MATWDTFAVETDRESELLLTTVRTYKMRSGRVTQSQRLALDELSGHFDLAGLAWDEIIMKAGGREIVADIGFGFGDSVVHYARTEPDRYIVGLEVHIPGVGAVCRDAAAAGLTNVGILNLDARQWLTDAVPAAALAGVRLFFPDPWPKKRHHKRRFIRQPVLDLIASRCLPGAFLHIATDIDDYAADAIEELSGSAHWELVPGSDHRRGRPVTRFERRALTDGRPIVDLLAFRV